MKFNYFETTPLILSLAQHSLATLSCRPQGPIVPVSHHLGRSDILHRATSDLAGSLDSAVNGTIEAGWPVENTSFSLGLIALGQDGGPAMPLWEYHHLAAGNVNGTKSLDRNSQYLIGSVSKVITDAVLIRSGLDLDEPVAKYLPELTGPSVIEWKDVTLRHLASHMAGIPPNYGFSEYYYIKSYFETLGFPPVNDTDYPPCGVIGLNSDCKKDQLLKEMLTAHPVARQATRPVYSNIAFNIISYAIQACTGLTYPQQLEEYLTRPFNMTSTFPSPGNDSLAVIPPGESTWGASYEDGAPGGGLVSTLSDLSILLHSILSSTLLPTPTLTRQWLQQPVAHAGSPNTLVGAPWEIFLPAAAALTPRRPRSIPVYSKGGAAYGYSAKVSLVPELGFGIILLTAGPADAGMYLLDVALAALTPAVDDAARAEVEERGYLGLFERRSGGRNVVEITQDADSLLVKTLRRDGNDMLAGIRTIMAATMGRVMPGVAGGDPTAPFRMFPAGVSVAGEGDGTVREDWRLWWEVNVTSSRSGLPGAGLSRDDCMLWPFADWLHYGGEAVDRVVFVKDGGTGEVVGVEVPFLRTGVMMARGRG